MPILRIVLSLFLGLTLIKTHPVSAQAPSSAQVAGKPSVLSEVFPQPTGQNGYEEILAAADTLEQSKAASEFERDSWETGTLTQKRAVFADAAVRNAMELFRQGMKKPLISPHGRPQEALLRAYAHYRRLARWLFVYSYVLCSDGRTSEAVDTLQDALKFSYSVQSDSSMGGLVGVAINAIAVKAVQQRLEQFSERDCKRMTELIKQLLAAPDPAIPAFTAERDNTLKSMQENFPADASFPRDKMVTGMKLHLDAYIDNLSRPYWERKPAPPLQGDKLVVDYVSDLAQTIDPNFVRAQDNFVRDQARIQMLGVQAAIMAYRWEHNTLPGGLEILKLGKMTLDPFTGQRMQYKLIGSTAYELTSPSAP